MTRRTSFPVARYIAVVAVTLLSMTPQVATAWGPHMHAAIALKEEVSAAARDAFDRIRKMEGWKDHPEYQFSLADYVSGAVAADLSSSIKGTGYIWDTWGGWYHATPPYTSVAGTNVTFEWHTWHECWGKWIASCLVEASKEQERYDRTLSFALGWIVHTASDNALDTSGSDLGFPNERINLNGTLILRQLFEVIAVDSPILSDTIPGLVPLPDSDPEPLKDNLCMFVQRVCHPTPKPPPSYTLFRAFGPHLRRDPIWFSPGPPPRPVSELFEDWSESTIRHQIHGIRGITGYKNVVLGIGLDAKSVIVDPSGWVLIDPRVALNLLELLELAPAFWDETVGEVLDYYAWGVDNHNHGGDGRPPQLGSKQRAIAMLGFISKPTILSFAINDGAPSTSQRAVRRTSETDSETTHVSEMRASENADFSGADWEAYANAKAFTLTSPGNGPKVVYFQVRNRFGESERVSATIELKEAPYTEGRLGDIPVWIYDTTPSDALNGKIYLFGGRSPSYLNLIDTVHVYDVATDTWRVAAGRMPYRHCGRTNGTATWGGKIYITPGLGPTDNNGWGTHQRVIEFDPATETAVEKASFGATVWRSSPVAVGNYIYWLGCAGIGQEHKIWRYSPATDTMTQVSALASGGRQTAAVLGPDGRVYAIGGWSTGGHASIDIYDPSTNTCVVSPTRLPVADGVAAWPGVDGLIYAARGPFAGLLPAYLWAYNIAGTIEDVGFDFSFTPVLNAPSYGRDPATGKVYLFGGVTRSGAFCNTVYVLTPNQ